LYKNALVLYSEKNNGKRSRQFRMRFEYSSTEMWSCTERVQ